MSAPDCPPAAGPKRAPKRSQIDRTTALVLQTTAALLRESGYRQLTVERIVQRSGVARSTVYRHWKNVAELAVQAFDNAIGPNPPTPDLGDIRADLLLMYGRFSDILSRSIWRTVLPSIIDASKADPLFDGLLGDIINQRKESGREIFRRAIRRGEIKPDANIEWAIDTLSGLYYHRLLMAGGDLKEDGMVEWLIDSVLSQIRVA